MSQNAARSMVLWGVVDRFESNGKLLRKTKKNFWLLEVTRWWNQLSEWKFSIWSRYKFLCTAAVLGKGQGWRNSMCTYIQVFRCCIFPVITPEIRRKEWWRYTVRYNGYFSWFHAENKWRLKYIWTSFSFHDSSSEEKDFILSASSKWPIGERRMKKEHEVFKK